MDQSKQEAIIEQALTLIKNHFKFLNEGNLEAARRQLFYPSGVSLKPLDVYLERMYQLRPFQLISIWVSRFENVRQKRHGNVATIWIHIVAICVSGEKSADITVWWFPEKDRYKISARPSHWITQSRISPDCEQTDFADNFKARDIFVDKKTNFETDFNLIAHAILNLP